MTDAPNPRRTPSCPICGKPTDDKLRPFCSRRCANVDLNRWLSGIYAVPGRPAEDDDEAPLSPRAEPG